MSLTSTMGTAASWIMDPLDLFGTRVGREGAKKQKKAMERASAEMQELYAGQQGKIQAGTDQSLADLYAAQSQGAGALTQGGQQAQAYFGKGRGALGQGFQGAMGQIAGGPYDVTGQRFAMQDVYGSLGGPVNLEEDPGYQFRLEQGEQAINRAASAAGGRHGGKTLKALQAHGQGLASQEYDNAFSRQQARNAQRMQAGMGLDQMRQAALLNQAGRSDQMSQFGAGLNMKYGSGLAGLYGQQAGAAMQTGQSLADLYRGSAQDMAGTRMQGMDMSNQMIAGQAGAIQYGAQPAGMVDQYHRNSQTGISNTASSIAGLF